MPANPIVPDTSLPDDPIEAAIRSSIEPLREENDDLDVDGAGDPDPVEPEPIVETPPADADPAVAPPVVEPVVADPAAAAAAAAKPADAPKEDKFATEHGIKAQDKSGRENRIPYSRIRDSIVPNAVKRAKTEWETTVLTPLKAQAKEYETRLNGIAGTENLMFGLDPKTGQALAGEAGVAAKRQFLQQLAISIPGYKELLSGSELGLGDTKTGGKGAPATANAVVDPNDPEPQPDVIENGVAVGWSAEGLAKMRAWDRRTAAREGAKAAADAIRAELKPLTDTFQSVQQKNQTLSAIDRTIDEATTWPGFKENADGILAELNALPAGTREPMRAAYNSFMWKRANQPQTDRVALEAELRQQFAKELQGAPRSTSTAAGALSTRAAQDVEQTGDPVEDAIRRSIRGLK